MVNVWEGATGELIGAFALTILLGISRWLRNRMARRRDVKHVRSILAEGQALVMNATDVLHKGDKGANARSPADVWRAMRYNSMIEKLRIVLELQVNLSHTEKKDVFDALDWFHTEEIPVLLVNGGLEPVWNLPAGRWPTKDMSIEHARKKFENLRAIKWLKLKDKK